MPSHLTDTITDEEIRRRLEHGSLSGVPWPGRGHWLDSVAGDGPPRSVDAARLGDPGPPAP